MVADSKFKELLTKVFQKESELQTFNLAMDSITILLEWSTFNQFKELKELENLENSYDI